MIYCKAINYGVGFITHDDKEKGSIIGYTDDLWVVADNHDAWVAKVNGSRMTLVEAQAIVDAQVELFQADWDADEKEADVARDEGGKGTRPTKYILPS